LSEKFLTRAEYSRHRDVARSMVTQYEKAGKLIFNDDGLIDVRRSDALIDSTMTARGGDRSGKVEQNDEKVSYLAAKAREANSKATLAELEVQERSGALARTEGIDKRAFELAHEAREKLFSIPDRLAVQLAAESDPAKVHELLTVDITNIARELSGK